MPGERLHPLSVGYRAGESITRLAWVLFVVTIGSQQIPGFGPELAVGVVVVALFAAVGYQYLRYRRFTYELTDDTLDIDSGVLSRRTREIPYGRVQNVDITRNPIQRALGLAAVSIETAGGGETEADLRYVSGQEARRLQEELGRRKRSGSDAEDEVADHELLFSITPRELALLGAVSVDLRLVSFATILVPVVAPSLAEAFVDPLLALAVAAPVVLAVLVVLAAVASAAYSVAAYYGFRLSRAGDELRYERGLLQQYSGTIPLSKVQALVIEENVLARRLGYAALSVETAGYAPGDDSGSQAAVPLAERERVLGLARSIEDVEDPEPEFQRPPRRARTRYVVRYGLVVLALTALAYAVVRFTGIEGPWFLVATLGVLAPPAAHLKWRNLGWALRDGHAVTREGFWTRRTRVVPYYRVQTVVDSRTVFQRRRNLATVTIDTAGASGLVGGDARALDVDAAVAERLREELGERLQAALAARRHARRGPTDTPPTGVGELARATKADADTDEPDDGDEGANPDTAVDTPARRDAGSETRPEAGTGPGADADGGDGSRGAGSGGDVDADAGSNPDPCTDADASGADDVT